MRGLRKIGEAVLALALLWPHSVSAFDACTAAQVMANEPNCPNDPSLPCRILSQVRIPTQKLCTFDFGERIVEIGSAAVAGTISLAPPTTELRIIAGSLTLHPRGVIDGGGQLTILTAGAVALLAADDRSALIDVSDTDQEAIVQISAGGSVLVQGDLRADRGPDWNGEYDEPPAVHIDSRGDITVDGELSAKAYVSGPLDFRYGGGIVLDASGSVRINGRLVVTGGRGGYVSIASLAQVVVNRIDGDASAIEQAGANLGIYGQDGVELAGLIDLRGGPSSPEGGSLSGVVGVIAPFGDIAMSGRLRLDARGSDGFASRVQFRAGRDITLLPGAEISADGQGYSYFAGAELDAGRDLAILGVIDASNGAQVGDLELLAGRNIEIRGAVRANGTLYDDYSQGGVVTAMAGRAGSGDVEVSGLVDATAGGCLYGSREGYGGHIEVSGCDIHVTQTGSLRVCARQPGDVQLHARGTTSIEGAVLARRVGANGTPGPITMDYVDVLPSIAPTAETTSITFVPRQMCIAANDPPGCVLPCSSCGNGIVEPAEDCEPSDSLLDCRGCSATCQHFTCGEAPKSPFGYYPVPEGSVACALQRCDSFGCPWTVPVTVCPAGPMCPGDCDGNGTVSADEIQSAIRLTMACATPSVACAEARELEDCPAADIDQDGLMRASELTRIVSNSTIFPNGCPP